MESSFQIVLLRSSWNWISKIITALGDRKDGAEPLIFNSAAVFPFSVTFRISTGFRPSSWYEACALFGKRARRPLCPPRCSDATVAKTLRALR